MIKVTLWMEDRSIKCSSEMLKIYKLITVCLLLLFNNFFVFQQVPLREWKNKQLSKGLFTWISTSLTHRYNVDKKFTKLL